MTVGLSTRVRRVDRLLFVHVGDEYLALDADSQECFCLNGTGMEIWDLLAEPMTVGALCERLGRVFVVSPDQCRAEVTALLTAWQAAGLLEVADGSEA